MHRYVLLMTALTSILIATGSVGQAPAPADVDQWMACYKAAGGEYAKVFRNLVAEETKVIETFDSSDRLQKRREIVSDLLVYQSSRNSGEQTTELRDVRSVDGKPVNNRDKLILDLIRQAGKTDSVEREIERIELEGLRYDGDCSVYNSTIYPQSFAFRDHFRFEWVGRDRIGDNDVVIIDFHEDGASMLTMPSEYSQMGVSAVFARGRLWIDATTFQLRQERAEIAGIHPAEAEPLTMMRLQRENINADNSLGILTPKRIVIDHFIPRKTQKNQPPAFGGVCRTTLTYGAFHRFDVTTEQTISPPAR